MRKAAIALALALLLCLSTTPTILIGHTPGSSPHDASQGQGYAPQAGDFIYPIGNPRVAPTFDPGGGNGYYITQMFNDSCDPALGQGYYYAGQYFCGHTGVDLSDKQAGDAVHATANGVVVFAGYNSTYGEMVRIQHLLPDGTYIYSQYEHMEYGSLLVSVGQVVTLGQTIGLVGSTGFVTGAHLHFEIKSVNEDGVGYTFGNAALLYGYDDPIAYVANHAVQPLATATAALAAPVATNTATSNQQVAGYTNATTANADSAASSAPVAVATAATATGASTTASGTGASTTASNGGEQQGVLRDFYHQYPAYVTVTTDHLNVRAGSGYEYAPLNSVQKGARLGYVGMTGNGWVHVALPGAVSGYVVRQWVDGGSLPRLPPITMSAALQPPFVVVADARYPARNGPLMRDMPIETLRPGEKLTYLGTRVSWDEVILPTGRIGWVLNWYLRRPPGAAAPGDGGAHPSVASPAHGDATSRRDQPHETRARAVAARVASAPAPTLTPTSTPTPVPTMAGPYVVTTNDGVYLRGGPRLAAPVIETLSLGTKLHLNGYHISWVSVVAPDGATGYVSGRFVNAPAAASGAVVGNAATAMRRTMVSAPAQPALAHGPGPRVAAEGGAPLAHGAAPRAASPAAHAAAQPYLIVSVRAANLRAAPNHKAEVVRSAQHGTRLILRTARGAWALVQAPDGTTAWIMRDLTHQ